MANAADDDFIEWLEETYGFEGSGRWWRILEIIAQAMDKNRMDPSATHTWKKWQSFLRGKRSQLLDYLLAIEQRGKINLEVSEFNLKIICPKILKMRDEYSRKSGHTPDNPHTHVRTVDKETDTEKEKKKEKKKSAQAPLNDSNQINAELSVLPDWIPDPEWNAYIEMRKKIRKPMTQYAQDLAVKQLKRFKDRGLDIREILNKSTLNNWTGLFEIKVDGVKPSANDKPAYHKTLSNYKS